ncbi:MAG: hypothetical protein AAF909_11845 [Pseudomonadota bacterium]
MGLSETVAVISALIAAISVWINIRVVNRQIDLQTEELRAAVDMEKTRWLGDALAVFAEAEAVCLTDRETAIATGTHLRLAQRFSILADQGRISFPNLRPEDRGRENPEAYQGIRQPAINAVILAHDVMQGLAELGGADGAAVQTLLFDCRRVLVSEVQRSVDPRRREQALRAQNLRSAAERDVSRGEIRRIIGAVRAFGVSRLSFTTAPPPQAPPPASAARQAITPPAPPPRAAPEATVEEATVADGQNGAASQTRPSDDKPEG